jgi:hypothetical protein
MKMEKSNANPSIKCTVNECEYHCQDQQYCSLDSIKVGTHEQNPTQKSCTDCESFELKKSY